MLGHYLWPRKAWGAHQPSGHGAETDSLCRQSPGRRRLEVGEGPDKRARGVSGTREDGRRGLGCCLQLGHMSEGGTAQEDRETAFGPCGAERVGAVERGRDGPQGREGEFSIFLFQYKFKYDPNQIQI